MICKLVKQVVGTRQVSLSEPVVQTAADSKLNMDVRIVSPIIFDETITSANEMNTISLDGSNSTPASGCPFVDPIFVLLHSLYDELLNLPIEQKKPIKQTLEPFQQCNIISLNE